MAAVLSGLALCGCGRDAAPVATGGPEANDDGAPALLTAAEADELAAARITPENADAVYRVLLAEVEAELAGLDR
ncbi:MAG: hypothetical protein ACYTJ0_12070 [Planctomycetota bacterium]|jgi:hypothetical protein